MPTYKEAINWIAENDDTDWLHEPNPILSVTASMVADIWKKTESEVIDDIRMQVERSMKAKNGFSAYTDYPFSELGDDHNRPARIRQVRVVGYDRDKYATIVVEQRTLTVKAGYLYITKGRCGEAKVISIERLRLLPFAS